MSRPAAMGERGGRRMASRIDPRLLRDAFSEWEATREDAESFEFYIRGVSKEAGRQELVQDLLPDEALMLVPEYFGGSRILATAVKTMDGMQLGWVPSRDRRERPPCDFPDEITFAHVLSIGQISCPPYWWGAKVEFLPSMHPLHAMAVPSHLADELETLAGHVDQAELDRLHDEALRQAHGKCHITGRRPSQGIVAVPRWFENERDLTFVLKDFICIDKELDDARQNLLSGRPTELTLWLFQATNGFTYSEVAQYIEHQTALRQLRESEGWDVDVSCLYKRRRPPPQDPVVTEILLLADLAVKIEPAVKMEPCVKIEQGLLTTQNLAAVQISGTGEASVKREANVESEPMIKVERAEHDMKREK